MVESRPQTAEQDDANDRVQVQPSADMPEQTPQARDSTNRKKPAQRGIVWLTALVLLGLAAYVSHEKGWIPPVKEIAGLSRFWPAQQASDRAQTAPNDAVQTHVLAQPAAETPPAPAANEEEIKSLQQAINRLNTALVEVDAQQQHTQQLLNQMRERNSQATDSDGAQLQAQTQALETLRAEVEALEQSIQATQNQPPLSDPAQNEAAVLLQLLALSRQEFMNRPASPNSIRLLELVDQRLQRTEVLPYQRELRARVIELLQTLSAQQDHDLEGVLLRLLAMRKQISALPFASPSVERFNASSWLAADDAEQELSWWQQLLTEFGSLVSIEKIQADGQNAQSGPELSLEQRNSTLIAMDLALGRMALALQQGHAQLYRELAHSLRARIVSLFDSDSVQVQTFITNLDDLRLHEPQSQAQHEHIAIMADIERMLEHTVQSELR